MKKQKGFTLTPKFGVTRKRGGFTLIELLVVIAIIGLLSTLAVVSLNNARQKSRDAKRVADVKQISTALEIYYNDKNGYPVSAAMIGINGLKLCSDAAAGFQSGACTSSQYITAPTAPTPIETGCIAADNSYSYVGTATGYSIKYCLGNQTGDVTAGNHSATQSGLY